MAEPDTAEPSPVSSRRSVATRLDGFDRWRERYRDAGLTAILVMQALIMFLFGPLAGMGVMRPEIVEALRIGMATVAVLIVNRYHPIGFVVALVFFSSLVTTTYVRSGTATQAVSMINTTIVIVFDIAVAWIVAHAAFDSGRISVHRIMGALILYLYIGLIFAGLYRLGGAVLQPAFEGMTHTRKGLSDYLYFSMGALTTAGSGNIVPIHPFLRSLAILESVIGQLYPATFIARLVTLHGSVLGRGNSGAES